MSVVLSDKWGNSITTLSPMLRDHRRRGSRKNVRIRSQGRAEQNCVFCIWQDSFTHELRTNTVAYAELYKVKLGNVSAWRDTGIICSPCPPIS